MQHTLQKIILILFSVLLFSGAVSTDTAPQAHDSSSTTDPRLLRAIKALEQKAVKETQIIQALNERIKQLELKIAALNSSVVKNQAPEQVNRESIKLGTAQHIPHEPAHIIGSSAIIQNGNTVSGDFFNSEDLFDRITPHLIPISAGLLTIFLLVLMLRINKRKHSTQLLSSSNETGVTANAGIQEPLLTNEKNALLAQKLAALRTAVEQGKQRRHQKE